MRTPARIAAWRAARKAATCSTSTAHGTAFHFHRRRAIWARGHHDAGHDHRGEYAARRTDGAATTEDARHAARRFARGAIHGDFTAEALHCYTDASGETSYWRIRVRLASGGKWIRPMRRGQNGEGYALGEPNFASGKPLYLLHKLAARAGMPCWFAEGENCADALAKLGLLATTSGSATSDDRADFSPMAGRFVTIWPDNDAAGIEHAERVSAKLKAIGCTVETLDATVLGLDIHGDCLNWLNAHPGASAADLATLPRLPLHAGAASAPAGADWPEPQSLVAKFEPEPYPLDALPNTLRKAIEEVQEFTQAPIAMVASSALAAVSLAIHAHADVQRAGKLNGPTSLFLLTIADSGERKSTCDGFFTKAIRDYEAAQAEKAKPELKDYAANAEAWEAKRSGIKDKIRQLAKGGEPTAEQESALRDLENHKPKPPRIPRLFYVDATPEALAYGLAKQWPSGGVVSAEGGIVFGSHGMGKDSVMRNLSLRSCSMNAPRSPSAASNSACAADRSLTSAGAASALASAGAGARSLSGQREGGYSRARSRGRRSAGGTTAPRSMRRVCAPVCPYRAASVYQRIACPR